MTERPVPGVSVYEGPQELARAAAIFFVERAAEVVLKKGCFTAVLSGGSTPRKFFRCLSSEEFAPRVPWQKVHLFWGDERCVPPDDPESNFRAAFEDLISRVDIPEANVHRFHAELPPERAAYEYEAGIREFFASRQVKDAAPAVFDLVFLGLGSDGHTLSVFPSGKAGSVEGRIVVETYVEKLNAWRLTMTPALVNRAVEVVFLVSGKDKARVLKDVLSGDAGRYPAALIRPSSGRLLWMVDREAASLL